MEAEVEVVAARTKSIETRRRKIVERGSDRLALITGRIKTLDSPASTSLSHHSRSQSTPALFLHDPQHLEPANFHGYECEADESPSRAAHIRSPTIKSLLNFFTPKKINSSIIASENARVFCSIVIGLLVILSYASFPQNTVKSKSFLASKPLCLVLITDFTIVLARVMVNNQRDEEFEEVEKHGHHMEGALKILEVGLVLYQTIRGIFIDLSFYVVVVICGLSVI